MNILKKLCLICIILSVLFQLSCSKNLHFSGISENSMNQLLDTYQTQKYTKDDIIKIIGSPLVREKSDSLWIYRLQKEKGNDTFKKTIFNKTLKLKFVDGILKSVEEVKIN